MGHSPLLKREQPLEVADQVFFNESRIARPGLSSVQKAVVDFIIFRRTHNSPRYDSSRSMIGLI